MVLFYRSLYYLSLARFMFMVCSRFIIAFSYYSLIARSYLYLYVLSLLIDRYLYTYRYSLLLSIIAFIVYRSLALFMFVARYLYTYRSFLISYSSFVSFYPLVAP